MLILFGIQLNVETATATKTPSCLGWIRFLTFHEYYLPAQIGGIMDAPILLIPFVNTKEVQRQAHDFDVSATYPIEFYKKTLEKGDARPASAMMDVISHRLGTEAQFEGFQYTTPCTNINLGNANSSYKEFKSMIDKLHMQLELGEKIDAVDARRVALKVLNTHFMRDIAGNLRAFSTQGFRCKSCNKKFRRLPLKGKCSVLRWKTNTYCLPRWNRKVPCGSAGTGR